MSTQSTRAQVALWEAEARAERSRGHRPHRAETLEPTSPVRIEEEHPLVTELREAAIEAGALRELDQQPRLAPQAIPPSCEKHEWPAPEHRHPHKPRPPASLCPSCLQDTLPTPPAPRTGGETHSTKVGGGSGTGLVGETAYAERQPGEVEKRELLRWRERQRALGGVIPGSDEEAKAVEFLDGAREFIEDSKPRVLYQSRFGDRVLMERPDQVQARLRRRPRPAWRRHVSTQFGPTFLDTEEFTVRA